MAEITENTAAKKTTTKKAAEPEKSSFQKFKEMAEAYRKHMNERVPVLLFKDNGKYKDPLYVSVNGYSATIERGKKVMVPRFVKEVIEQSAAQDEETARKIEELMKESQGW